MDAKILTLMALLSLAALTAGFPSQNDRRVRTEIDALRLISKIAREQVFKQEKETTNEIKCSEEGYPCFRNRNPFPGCCPGLLCISLYCIKLKFSHSEEQQLY